MNNIFTLLLKLQMASFYDSHATAFSKSRFRIWPCVKKFLDILPPNSKVLDIGCGNGKNMTYRTDIQMYGLEKSQALCNICAAKGLKVVQGDALKLPFEDNSFDAIIMIAVIHHIHPEQHKQVLQEIKRVLKPSGKCLITNWSVEQPEDARRQFQTGLNWVIWKGKEGTPLPYWIMDKALAHEFVNYMPDGLQLTDLEWEAGNWYIFVRSSL